MTYEELEDFIVNTLNLQPEDFDSYDAYLEAIALEFKQNYNYGVENVTSDIWNTRIDEAEIYEKERRFQEEEKEEAEIQIDEAEERIRQGMTALERLEERPKPKPSLTKRITKSIRGFISRLFR